MIKVLDRRNVGTADGIGGWLYANVNGFSRALNDSSVRNIWIIVHDGTQQRTHGTDKGIPATATSERSLKFPLLTDFFGQNSVDGYQDTGYVFSLVVLVEYTDNTSESVELDTAIEFVDTAADDLHPTPDIKE